MPFANGRSHADSAPLAGDAEGLGVGVGRPVAGETHIEGLQTLAGAPPVRRELGFEMPLNGGQSKRILWGVWAGGNHRSFEGEPDEGSYEGEMTSGYLGADARGDGWVAGLAVSRSQADIIYDFGGAAEGNGDLELDLNTAYPYVQWSPRDRASMWAILGFGTGEVLAVRDRENGGEPTDLSMAMGVAGARFALDRPGGLDLAIRGDAGFLKFETGDGIGSAEDLTVGIQQANVGVEASWALTIGESTLAPFVDVGGRFDGGDGPTGGGIEVAAGMSYRGPSVGFQLKGRTLVMHGADGYSESGVSGTILVGPRADGRGWRLALTPRWGRTAETFDFLRERDLRRGMPRRGSTGFGLRGRVSYGLGLAERPGSVVPFGAFDLTKHDGRRIQVGVSYQLEGTPWQPPVFVELAGERVEIYPNHTDYRFTLSGRANL